MANKFYGKGFMSEERVIKWAMNYDGAEGWIPSEDVDLFLEDYSGRIYRTDLLHQVHSYQVNCCDKNNHPEPRYGAVIINGELHMIDRFSDG